MEIVHVVAAIVVVPASPGRQHFQTAASGTVQRFLPRGVGPVVDAIRRLQRSSNREDSTDDVVRTLTVQIAELTGPSH